MIPTFYDARFWTKETYRDGAIRGVGWIPVEAPLHNGLTTEYTLPLLRLFPSHVFLGP